MKKLLICMAAAAGLAAGSATAADLPVKVSPPAAVYAWSWTGFYIGGHGGYGWKENTFQEVISTAPLVTIGGIKSKGWVYGGQAGYNWQYGRWVAGLEIDVSATNIKGDSDTVIRNLGGGVTVTDIVSDDVKLLGTARARVGFAAFTGCCWNALLYGTGGLAWERVNRIETTSVVAPGVFQTAVSTEPRNHFGWVAGAGGELQLGNSNWIARLEYLHYDFGQVDPSTTVTQVPGTSSFADSPGRQTIDVVRGALSYKFSDGPAVAANMPVKALPPVAATWSWAGFYLGGHGGYGWKENSFQEVLAVNPTITIGGIKSKGWVYGGQAGYNWQYGRWVAGLEIDVSATNIKGDSDTVIRNLGGGVTLTDIASDDVKLLGTARARVGFAAFTGCCWNALFYGTGGLAWERVNRIDTNILVAPGVFQTVVSTDPRNHFGWVAGAGGELRLGNTNWIARVEYLHYDFGEVEQSTTVTQVPGTSFADSAGRQTIDVVRGALSYKFSDGPAVAANMPVKALPPVAATWSWAGFYLGGHGGYGWKENTFQEVISIAPLVTIGGIKSKGWVFGGQAGYNWQYGRWVAGLEIDVSATNIKGDSDTVIRNFAGPITITDIESDHVKLLGTARARVGFAVFTGCCWNALLYGTGGLAWERVNRIDTEVVVTPAVSQTAVSTEPRNHFGWVAGAGGELQLGNSNWIGRLEYLHYDFGQVDPSTTVTSVPGTGSFADSPGRQTIDVVRGALSYKFMP